jgi:hypothetical protein
VKARVRGVIKSERWRINALFSDADTV